MHYTICYDTMTRAANDPSVFTIMEKAPTLLGPSPSWKRLLALFYLRQILDVHPKPIFLAPVIASQVQCCNVPHESHHSYHPLSLVWAGRCHAAILAHVCSSPCQPAVAPCWVIYYYHQTKLSPVESSRSRLHIHYWHWGSLKDFEYATSG